MIKKLLSIFNDSPQSFEGQEEGERVIAILRRHPLTIFISLSMVSFIALLPILGFLIFFSFIVNDLLAIFIFISSLWYMTLWLLAFRFLTLYTLNTVIITDKRIIDRDQHGFFNQKISELHMHRVQDVSIHINGILETVFRFGDVVVQTAASEKQFVFHQMPNPDDIKDLVMRTVAAKRNQTDTNP